MKDQRAYLLDIVSTIDQLLSFAAGYKLADLRVVEKRWAVERAISILGEAAFQLHKPDKNLSITEFKNIVGMRHIVVHDYDRLDEAQLLVIIQRHLPVLRAEAPALI